MIKCCCIVWGIKGELLSMILKVYFIKVLSKVLDILVWW